MTLRSSDLQSDGDLDSIRNSCDVFLFPMIICFAGVSWWFAFHWPFLPPTTADLPIPQTHYYGMNRGLFDIGNIDSQAHGFRKWKYSWGLSHTTCMLLIEVSYFYSISMKFETNPSFSYFWYSISPKVSKTSSMVSDISRLKINKAISTNLLISDLGRKLKLEIRDWLNA